VFRGKVDNLKQGELLWALLQPADSGRVYPGVGPCSTQDDGMWNCPDFILGPYDPNGVEFRVLLVRADAAAVSAFFSYELNRPDETFPGLDQLPGGAPIGASVTIHQQS